MTDICSCAIEDGVAVVTMCSGKVNAFDHELLDTLSETFKGLGEDSEIKSVILTGQEGIFSAGFDLRIMEKSLEDAEALVKSGLELLRQLYLFPKPLVVASGGHALAMGAMILLVADYRIGVTGQFKVGLNETNIGMALPQLFVEIARERIPLSMQTQAIILGLLFEPHDARDNGFYDVMSTPEQLAAQARDVAKDFGDYVDQKAFAENKLRHRGALLTRFPDNSV